MFLDALAAFFLLILALVGYQRGVLEELGQFIGLLVATLAGIHGFIPISSMFLSRFDWDGPLTAIICFTAIFFMTLLLVYLTARTIQIMLLHRQTRLGDRLLGFIFGLGKGGIVLILAVWLITLFPAEGWTKIIRQQSRLFDKLNSGRRLVINVFWLNDELRQAEKFLSRYEKNDNSDENPNMMEPFE